MSRIRTISRGLQVTVAIVSSAMLMGAASPSEIPACERDAAWASAHWKEVPTTLAGFSGLSAGVRKYTYTHLSVAARKSLWREQLTAYSHDPALTEAQHVLVREALGKLDVYLTPKSGRAHLLSDRFEARVRSAFPFATAKRIFATLGPLSESANPTRAVARASIVGGLDDALLIFASRVGFVPPQGLPDCGCSQGNDWCGGSTVCTAAGCNWTDSGCGLFWLSSCNGQCNLAT